MYYWKLINQDGTTNSVESHSIRHIVPKGIQISKNEYDEYIAGLSPVIDSGLSLIERVERLESQTGVKSLSLTDRITNTVKRIF